MSLLQKIKDFYFRCFHLYQLDVDTIDAKTPFHQLPAGYDFKMLGKEDLHHFILIDNDKVPVAEERWKHLLNWQAFGIFEIKTGTLVYFCWINRTPSYFAKEIHKPLHLAKDECIFEDDFTKVGHRGKGLHSYAMQRRIEYCRQQGIHKVYIIIECGNSPALKTIHSFGFKQTTANPYTYRRGSISESFQLLRKKIISRQ